LECAAPPGGYTRGERNRLSLDAWKAQKSAGLGDNMLEIGTRARIRFVCFSNGEVLPPTGIGAHVPSLRKRCIHLIAELTLTSLFGRFTSEPLLFA
jgi:hypothetical protein